MLELFAPPPATNTSSTYTHNQPYLKTSRYTNDNLLKRWPPEQAPARRLRVLRPPDVLWRRDLDVLVGILVSMEHLTVATLEIGPGEVARIHKHNNDKILITLAEPL